MSQDYPEFVQKLPDADIPMPGVKGKLLQAGKHQVVFLDIEPIGRIPPHAHGAQWGIVLQGEMELTIGGQTRTVRAGESYFVPAGVAHEANFKSRFRAIDFFDEPTRYKARR